MERKDSEIWYAVVRRLGEEGEPAPLTRAEAWQEYQQSPAAAAGESAPRARLPVRRRRRAHASGRWRLAAVLVAAGVLLVSIPLLRWPRPDAQTDRGSGSEVAVVPPAPQAASPPIAVDPPAAPAGRPDGAPIRSEPDPVDPPDPAEPADPAWFTRTADGGYLVAGKVLTPAEAEAYFADLKTPYRAQSEHVDLFTDHGIAFGERMVLAAETAFRRARELLGAAPPQQQRLHVFVVRDLAEYNELGVAMGGDEKSSAFYAFTTPWYADEPGERPPKKGAAPGMASVTQFSQSDELTAIYVAHATVEQFVRRLMGPDADESPPRWFIDGVAGYVERWQPAGLTSWSRERLAGLGGSVGLDALFTAYRPTEPCILTGGLLVAFLRSEADSDELRGAFQRVCIALIQREGLGSAMAALEQLLREQEAAFRAFAGV